MNIVFDIGNVLIKWDLHRAFQDHFETPQAIDLYLAEIGFADWNLEQDRGRSWAEANADLRARHGERAFPATEYSSRHAQTIQTPVAGTWALLDRLAARGHPLYAITNWSAESWKDAETLYPRLKDVFRDVVISGRERLVKPDPAIYRVLLDRNGLNAAECLFIDDSAKNVAGAKAVGMDAVQFTTPEVLEDDLKQRGLL
ncbi:HAD family hydrolase [Paracoccus pacificus]|uniref:HAD family hydrolase n=1 Tax=Paracoccus pacificus TaxID=1463598 RepID=A0ABW4R7R0_9RHOB